MAISTNSSTTPTATTAERLRMKVRALRRSGESSCAGDSKTVVAAVFTGEPSG